MAYDILKWDSHFFGIQTARILESRLNLAQLSELLRKMQAEHIKLVYWAAAEMPSFDTAPLGGRLTDKKVTFEADLTSLNPDEWIFSEQVQRYNPGEPMDALLELGVQAGEFSRFARDPQFPQEKFISLYREWTRKSLTGKMADDVLVIQTDGNPAGMVTVGKKDSLGEIGLIAVNAAFRGRQYGELLVRAAQRWYLDHGLQRAQVVTQGDNKPACQLYRKCDYRIKRTDYVYHFWL
jgi:dTDP-4-amino-4,6-dideoxy-D-galactose acyltransferase